ncbi:MAG: inner rane protein YihY, formerly thought to be RNase [Segetibacter sp.]|nr:inner rane protein YihY, formerly thought to be RNase [Segetibacter sp.]
MGKKKEKVITGFHLLADALKELKQNDPLRLAGATAFFTTFALPPILIILIQILGLVFQIEDLRDRFFIRLAEILGADSAFQIKSTFAGFKSLAINWYFAIGGFIFLMFVATTLFKVIKDSLNQIWDIKLTSKKALKKLEKRGVSIVVILIAGLLFLGGTLAESLQAIIWDHLDRVSPGTVSFISIILNQLISVLIVTTWFTILFKLLPDAKPSWKVVFVGGLFTGLLFTIGKTIIRSMLLMGDIKSVFGASSSIVLLLLFLFYSSFILYYGACFTKVYAEHIHEGIPPAEHSTKYEMTVKAED